MADVDWDPDLYLRAIREEIPAFDEFEDVQPAPEEFRRPDTQPESAGV